MLSWTTTVLLMFFVVPMGFAQRSVSERYLFDAANRERAAAGIAPLQWNPQAYAAALNHARLMAQRSAISHQFAGEPGLDARMAATGARFSAVAENVAAATDAVRVHDGWMHSEHHRENLLDPKMTSLAVATALRAGELFAVEDFARDVAELSFTEQEQAVIEDLRRIGVSDARASEAARATCAKDSGYVGEVAPRFVMRWTSTDLSQLPAQLNTRARSYTSAEVGACAVQGGAGFTTYRIAVMLR